MSSERVQLSNFSTAKETIAACHKNAETLIAAAKSTRQPGSLHISYHLAALALEEVGKASMILLDSLREDFDSLEERSLLEWIEDHERKLFWALWLTRFNQEADWKSIPWAMELAKGIHETRLGSLYVDPRDISGPDSVTEKQLDALIQVAESCLLIERHKTLRELSEDEKSDLQWFFKASTDPEMKPLVFSSGSFKKQEELVDRGEWIRWLRRTFEDATRENEALREKELTRIPPSDETQYEEKFRIKIRLKTNSHSIRPSQIKEWNRTVEKAQFFTTNDKSELIVQFSIPKAIQGATVWHAGFQYAMTFVASLNIATLGFFWWYLPQFTSKFYDSIVDVETNATLAVERVPDLKVVWPPSALKEPDYTRIGSVWAFVMTSSQEPAKAAVFTRYLMHLGLLAKNDVFGQFEPAIFIGLFGVLRHAMHVFGDWDGREDGFEAAAERAFGLVRDDQFMVSFRGMWDVAKETMQGKNLSHPITLEEVAKAKIHFDFYLNLKARAFMQRLGSDKGSS